MKSMTHCYPSALFQAGLSAAILSFCGAGVQAAGPYDNVLILTIDGFREADLMDPNLAADRPNIDGLRATGVTFTEAHTPYPTDSFPGLMSQITGAGPKTTGIYYDFAYSRSLYPPNAFAGSLPGTILDSTQNLDYNSKYLGGGEPSGATTGPFGSASINPALLPKRLVGSAFVPVYPHELLQVNTIFEVAHHAGLHTAFIDKHPAYEIVNGPGGAGVDDFYVAEQDAKVKIQNGMLLDAKSAGSTSGLAKVNTTVALSNAYDDFQFNALLNQMHGKTGKGIPLPGGRPPALFAMNFVAFGNAQRLATGGISAAGVVSADMHTALSHADANVGRVVSELKALGQWDHTLLVLSAKHGSSPRLGGAINLPTTTFKSALLSAGIPIVQLEQDDELLVWLQDPAQAEQARSVLSAMSAIDTVYAGSAELLALGFGDPAVDDRSPHVVCKFLPNYIVNDPPAKLAEHGGFADDDSHVALILASGGMSATRKGTAVTAAVKSEQMAVSALAALGLDPGNLEGAVAEHTAPLPGTGLPTQFDAWLQQRFTMAELAEPAVSGPGADPDGNGYSNLLDYAFGLTGHQSAEYGVQPLPVHSVATYRHRTNALDLDYFPEFSTDLHTWTAAIFPPLGKADNHDGTETLTVSDPAPRSEHLERFFRVRVLHRAG